MQERTLKACGKVFRKASREERTREEKVRQVYCQGLELLSGGKTGLVGSGGGPISMLSTVMFSLN